LSLIPNAVAEAQTFWAPGLIGWHFFPHFFPPGTGHGAVCHGERDRSDPGDPDRLADAVAGELAAGLSDLLDTVMTEKLRILERGLIPAFPAATVGL